MEGRPMKVLVTAASKYGSTAEIASAIGAVLTERGLDTTVLPPEDVGPVDEYDAVVLGSAVYAGHWMKAARELVGRAGASLSSRPVWLFSSGPVGDPPKPQEVAVDTEAMMGSTRAREHRVFVGKIEKKGLSFGDKAIAVALRVPDGDFRDWDDIRAWASEIADVLAEG
jgi:menaquinone-dependent protoporphyrinogen oxidase